MLLISDKLIRLRSLLRCSKPPCTRRYHPVNLKIQNPWKKYSSDRPAKVASATRFPIPPTQSTQLLPKLRITFFAILRLDIGRIHHSPLSIPY